MGAHERWSDFRYNDDQAAGVLCWLKPSTDWLTHSGLAALDQSAIDHRLLERLHHGARHFVRDTLEERRPPLRSEQAAYLESVHHHAAELLNLVNDARMLGTPADILLAIAKLRSRPKDVTLVFEIVGSLRSIYLASGMRIVKRTSDKEVVDHAIRDKATYVRFRLSCWLVREYESVTSKRATTTIHEKPDELVRSDAIEFLLAAMNPALAFVGHDLIKDETAKSEIRQVHRAWRNGVHPEDGNFHSAAEGNEEPV